MWPLYITIFGLGLVGLVGYWARQEGKKSARIQALKQELRGVTRVQTIQRRIERMPVESVRQRLHRIRR